MKTLAGWTTWLLLALLAVPAAAQNSGDQLSVKVQPRVVEVGEAFRYEINASTSGNSRIRVVQRPDFPSSLRIVGTSNAPSFVLRNGRAQRSLKTVYQVKALDTGKFDVGGPRVRIGNSTETGETLTVEVVERGDAPKTKAPSRKNDKLFVDYAIQPSRKTYVGEQITLVYYLFTASMGVQTAPQPPTEPSLDEFWIEDLSQKVSGRRETVQVDGRFMQRTALRGYALFPLRAGTTTIDPLSVNVRVGGFFSNQRMMEVASDPIEVEVLPLPPDPPDSFYDGNVGRWEFQVTTDRMTASVGEPIRIRVSAEGAGQVSRIELPPLPDIEGARVAGEDEKADRRIDQTTVRGTKTMEYTLVPTAAGTLDIPALEFSYFDPDLQKYRTQVSSPLKLTVRPGGDGLKAQPSPQAKPEVDQSEDQSVLETIIGKLRPPTNAVDSDEDTPDLLENPFYWGAVGLPLLGLLFLLIEPYARRWKSSTSPRRTRKKAVRDAKEHLERARAGGGQEALDDAHRALESYLVDALEIRRTRLSEDELPEELAECGAPEDVCRRAGELIAELNTLRYAPGGDVESGDVERLTNAVASLIDRLEDGASRGDIGAAVARTTVALLCLAVAFAMPAPAVAQDGQTSDGQTSDGQPSDVLASIEAAQDDGDWAAAADKWQAIAEQRKSNAEVQYNLGTALAHAGEYGRARLALERAALYAPQRPDIGQNRELVERIVRLRQIEEARGTVRENTTSEGLFWWRLAGQIPENSFPLAIALFVWVSLVFAVLGRVRGPDSAGWERWASILAFVFAVLCAAGLLGRDAVLDAVNPAVVLSDAPQLREGPSKHAASQRVSTVLVPGVMLPVVERRDGWVQLEFADGTRAWLEESAVEFVQPQES